MSRTRFAKFSRKDASEFAVRHEMLYSGPPGGARPVFAFSNLSRLNLLGSNPADADFIRAIREETDCPGSRIGSASFFGANLRRANLSNSSIRRGACLRGSRLIGADLEYADLTGADVRDSAFDRAGLTGAKVSKLPTARLGLEFAER